MKAPARHAVISSALFVMFFLLLQKLASFYFLYIEQNQMFLVDRHYILPLLQQNGGVCTILADFCLAFFKFRFCGAAITSLLLTTVAMLAMAIVQKIGNVKWHAAAFGLASAGAFLYVLFDQTFLYGGIVATILMLAALLGYLHIDSDKARAIYGIVSAPLLLYLSGSIAVIYMACMLIMELSGGKFNWKSAIPAIIFAIVVFVEIKVSYIKDYSVELTPYDYMSFKTRYDAGIYLWWLLPAVAAALAAMHASKIKPLRITALSFGYLLCAAALVPPMANRDLHPKLFEELDCYARAQEWDKIIESYNANIANPDQSDLYECYANLAFAENGQLVDRMFEIDQRGRQSLFINWTRTSISGAVLSDIYFSMGHIAMAQRMAFEANLSANGYCNPRMMERLIQTNLIYGYDNVVAKYIHILDKSLFYRGLADSYRPLLNNPAAVAAHPVLGPKQKCMQGENFYGEQYDLTEDLLKIIDNNPEHAATAEYLQALFLLDKDMDGLTYFLDKYYGTEVLPVLPKATQEAVVILSEVNEGYMDNFSIDGKVLSRFFKYRRIASDPNMSEYETYYAHFNEFSDTFWYYAMYKNLPEE